MLEVEPSSSGGLSRAFNDPKRSMEASSGEDPVLSLLSRIDMLCKEAYTNRCSAPAAQAPAPAPAPARGEGDQQAYQALSKENVDLRRENADLKRALQQHSSSSSSSNHDYEARLKALEADHFSVVQQKGQLEIRLARLEVDATSGARAMGDLEGKNNELREEAGKLKSELAAAQRGKNEGVVALRESEDELIAVRAVVEQTQRGAEALQTKLERAQEEHAACASRLRFLEGELAAAQAELKTTQAESSKSQRLLEAELAEARQGALATQGDAASTIAQARQAQVAAEARARELEMELRTARGDGKKLEVSLASTLAELASKGSALSIVTTRLNTAEGAGREAAAAHAISLSALQAEAAASAQRNSAAEMQHREILDACEANHAAELRKLEALLRKANEDTLSAVNRAEEAAESAAARIIALSSERDGLSRTIIELRALLIESVGESAPRPSTVAARTDISPDSSIGSPERSLSHMELVLGDPARPVILIEVGEFAARIGVYNPSSRRFELRFSCPAYTASPKPGCTPESICKSASQLAGPAYAYFRETGLFVGEDARFFLFDHPDPGLRGSLVLDAPALQDGRIVSPEHYSHLVEHCFRRLCASDGSIDDDAPQILLVYKLSFQQADFGVIGETIFDRMACSQVCLLEESVLKLVRPDGPSCSCLVDIGASRTTVYPCYEKIVLSNAVASTRVGGEHVTALLEKLLASQLEKHSSQLPRRRLELCRGLKERHAFVTERFDEAVRLYGAFTFDKVKVMFTASDAAVLTAAACSTGSEIESDAEFSTDISVSADLATPSGESVTVLLTRERFYCAEVLFQPRLFEGANATVETAGATAGLVETILEAAGKVDESVRAEVFATIVVAGRTALLPGLCARLQMDLGLGLARLGVHKFVVVLAERAESPSSSWDGAELRVRDDKIHKIEEHAFVTADRYADVGLASFDIVAFSH